MSSSLRSRVVVLAVTLAVWGRGEIASASPIVDTAGDFLATFAGAHHGAFDVISADGTFDGTTFHLSATLAAAVSAAPGGSTPLYVWGINTGTGVNNFANIGNPNVRFNTVATLTAAGVTSNPAFLGSISGNLIAIDIPLSALPASTGFAPVDYLWNLWPRDTSSPPAPAPAPVGGASAISDFAPDNAVARFTPVPEPSTLCLLGFGLAGVARRARHRRQRSA
jgi:hypothetical protein